MCAALGRSLIVVTALIAASAVSFAQGKEPKKKDLPKVEGRLIVEDTAALFGLDAVKRAGSVLAEVKDSEPRHMNVVTFKELPNRIKKDFDAATTMEARNRVIEEWAREEARGSRGLFVLICLNQRRVQVLADKQIRDKGFTEQDRRRVVEILTEKFGATSKVEKEEEKAALRDKGLILAAEYVRDAYKKIAK